MIRVQNPLPPQIKKQQLSNYYNDYQPKKAVINMKERGSQGRRSNLIKQLASDYKDMLKDSKAVRKNLSVYRKEQKEMLIKTHI